jgi:PilZ domain
MGRLGDHSVHDHRASRRHDVKTPIRVRLWKSAIPEHTGESENISQDGMYFATDLALSVGTVVEVLLKMPEEVSGEIAAEWRCTGHVVRVETAKLPNGEQVVGVQFDCYQVSKS